MDPALVKCRCYFCGHYVQVKDMGEDCPDCKAFRSLVPIGAPMAKDDFSEDHYACGPEVTDWDTPMGEIWVNKAQQTFEWKGREIGWMRMTNTPRPGDAPGSRDRTPPSVKNSQIGGTHYKDMVIQPFEYIHKNKLGYLEGTAVKYVSRWRIKGGVQDLEKAVHAIQYLIELEKGGA